MSIRDSFQNISNSHINISTFPKSLILAIILILGLSIYLSQSNTNLIYEKLDILQKSIENLNSFNIPSTDTSYLSLLIIHIVFFILYKILKSTNLQHKNYPKKYKFYEKTKLARDNNLYISLILIMIFFNYFICQFIILQSNILKIDKTLSYHLLFILNLLTIYYFILTVNKYVKDIIFSPVFTNLNLNNKNIHFSQKDEIIKENPEGLNFYATLTCTNKGQSNQKIIQRDLNKKHRKLLNSLIYDSSFDNILSSEHWYRVAYATFLYLMLFIVLIEFINIGKEIFLIQKSEIFHIFILIQILIFLIKRYISTKVYTISIVAIFYLYIVYLKDSHILFNVYLFYYTNVFNRFYISYNKLKHTKLQSQRRQT